MNDGGAIQSSLGNILGGMADAAGPDARARAQLTYQQTQGADIANQEAYEKLLAEQAAARGIPGLTSTFGANAQPGGGGGVPATAAALAQPPSATPGPGGRVSQVDESSFTPWQAYLTNEMRAGRLSPDALTTAVTKLGQPAVSGPGSDYGTQAGIVSAQAAPQHIAPGDTLLIDPRKGNVPGNAVTGGDAAAIQAEQKQRQLDIDDANQKTTLGAGAAANLQELQRLNQIYDTLVNTPDTSDLTGVVGDEALKFIAAKTGFDVTKVSSRIGAMQAIQARMNAMLGSTIASIQGDTPIRGILTAAKNNLPDPTTMNPEQYRGAVGQLTRVLQSQADEAGPALEFQASDKSKAAADAYRAKLEAVRARHAQDFPAQPEPGVGPGASTAPAPAPANMHAATPQETVFARNAISKGQSKADVIAHARLKGIDLGPNF